ncbi:MAG: PhzF family phenazine biosynthesis protein [Candidatus Kariarchaeaceae archaeon]|jgi:trans-2,3-dihydro-3-hydroxyanthranilate isomerase
MNEVNLTFSHEYFILNVFSDKGVDGGNQLAVLPNAEGLDEQQMLSITREFNFSETTFVTKIANNEADVRIFTPGKEIEYAGHPTVGTLNVLEFLHREAKNGERDTLYLNLKGGRVKGMISTENEEIGLVSFQQIPAKFIKFYDNRQKLLNLLGISDEDLYDNQSFHIIAVTGMKFLFVQLKDAKTLSKLVPDYSGLASEEFKEQDINVYVFAKEGLDGGNVRARFFVPLYNINEDPATGGIQSSFGLCLHSLGLLENNTTNEIIVEQGYEMGRPSKIYDKFTVENGKLTKTETGGNCYYFSRGKLGIF